MNSGSLSNHVLERRTSTESGLFELFSRDFEQIFRQIVSTGVKTLSIQIWQHKRLLKNKKTKMLTSG